MQKGIRHIGHCRHIPVAYVAIGSIGFRLIIKPKVDRGLEIGVVDQLIDILASRRAMLGLKRKKQILPCGRW